MLFYQFVQHFTRPMQAGHPFPDQHLQIASLNQNDMKKDLSFLLLLPLKVFTVLALVLAPAFMFLSFKAKNIYADLWQQLGTTKEKGIENMQTSFIYDYFNYYGAEKAKNLALGDRAAVAKDLMQFTKEYINSEAFKTKYADFRNSVKTEEPMITNKNKEDIRKEKIAETEKSISYRGIHEETPRHGQVLPTIPGYDEKLPERLQGPKQREY